MSKRSREKHARVEFTPLPDPEPEHDDIDVLCVECGFFPQQSDSDVCDACSDAEIKRP